MTAAAFSRPVSGMGAQQQKAAFRVAGSIKMEGYNGD